MLPEGRASNNKMFHYGITIVVFIAICSTTVNGDDVEEIRRKIMTKRHDGYVMDISSFVKFLADVQIERKQQKKQLDAIENLVKDFTIKTDNECKDITRRSGRQFDKIKKQINNIDKSIVSLNRKDKKLENQLVSMRNQKGNHITVAFYAWLSNNDTRRSTIVKYDRVTTNIGNCYNVDTGKFVAPVKGIYMFAVTVMNKGNNESVHLDIFKNYNRVGMVRSEATKDSDSGSTVIVLNLMVSDVVYAKFYHHHRGLSTYKDYAFNTFSGFLIKEQL